MSVVTVARTIPVSADRAFDAWTDPTEMAQWWWPQWADTTYELDARPGGSFRIEAAGVGIVVTGVYRLVERPHRLVFSWLWSTDGQPEDVEDEVEVTCHELPDGRTEVTVRHTSTAHLAEGGAEQGWNDVMDRLAKLPGAPA